LGGFSLNLSVAIFTVGLLAPVLEVGFTGDRSVQLGEGLSAMTVALALAANGVYLIGRAEPVEEDT
jgi:hypothetical protein